MKRTEYVMADFIVNIPHEREDYEIECKELGKDPKNVTANSKGPDAHIYAIAKAYLLHPDADRCAIETQLISAAADLLHASETMNKALEDHGKEISEAQVKATKLLLAAIAKAKGIK